jgi:hypothetical protein
MRALTFVFALAALTTACADLPEAGQDEASAAELSYQGLPGIDGYLDVPDEDVGPRIVLRSRNHDLPELGAPRIETPVARFPTVLPDEADEADEAEGASDDAANDAEAGTPEAGWSETDGAWPDDAPVQGDGDRPDPEAEAGDGDRPEPEGDEAAEEDEAADGDEA